MSHLDPEQLALIALGEPVETEAERDHLASCPACAADVAELSHAAEVGRSTMDEIELQSPPPRVWERIADELSLGASADVEPPTRPRRRAASVWALAASVALIVAVGAGLGIGFGNLAPTSIATASLDAFPDHPAAVGSAEVDEARDGTRTLTVSLEGAGESDQYREVWLIRADGSALISLGVLEGETGSFPIPPGVKLEEYDLVDISFEPLDGDPNHSGNSIVRGELSFA